MLKGRCEIKDCVCVDLNESIKYLRCMPSHSVPAFF